MTDPQADTLMACWLAQPTEDAAMTVADIHTRIQRFQTRKRCIAGFALPAAAIMAGCSIWLAWTAASTLGRLGGLAYLLWAVCAAVAVYWRWLRPSPPDADARASLDFHREQLMSELHDRRNLWLWCYLPLGCAYVLFAAGSAHPWGPATLSADALIIASFAVGFLASRIGARRLQRQITALDHFGKE